MAVLDYQVTNGISSPGPGSRPLKVALVHDYLNQYGGAERVLEELHALFPSAPVYTSMYWPEKMSATIRGLDVRTSFMQRLPLVRRNHQPFLLLYPLAFESFDLSSYDVVISNSSAFCKGVVTPPSTLHICYCLTPMRWVWNYHAYVERERLGTAARLVLPAAISQLRSWDVATAQNVDRFLAISRTVAARIRKYYRRDAAVIYPPVNCDAFALTAAKAENYYLIVSRLIPYKRIDLAVDAFSRLGIRLKIVGSGGRDLTALRARAGRDVEFIGRVSDTELKQLYAGCRGLVFPGEEDFGIAPLEANASGRPVIAYAGGGALDTVVDGKTGVLFEEQQVECVIGAIRRAEATAWAPDQLRAHARKFDSQVFRDQMQQFVGESIAAHAAGARFA
ncbi:MAG: glycosyltransferase [Chloroflexi bacterium]|nr:glycosyltransferase [Chloroflexota bacterium]